MSIGTAVVWGATGFIGRHLVVRLLACGWSVRVLVRDMARIPSEWRGRVECAVLGEGAPASKYEEALVGGAVAFHCAGSISESQESAEAYVDGTRRFVEAAARVKVEHVIHLSTVGVYGVGSEEKNKEWSVSDTPLGATAYARSRIEAENVAREVLLGTATRLTIVRVPMVVGPGMSANSLRRFFRVISSGLFPHPGQKESVLNCIGISRLVSILEGLARSSSDKQRTLQFSDAIRWVDLAQLYTKESGKSIHRIAVPVPLATLFSKVASSARGIRTFSDTTRYIDDSARVCLDNNSMPTTDMDLRALIALEARRNTGDHDGLLGLLWLTSVNMFARAGAGILPFVVAWFYGASVTSDALFWVFSIVLFLGGAFSNALETVVVPWVARQNQQSAEGAWLGNATACLVLPAIAGMGLIILSNHLLLGAGLILQPDAADLAVHYLYQTAFVVLFMVWAGLWSGVLLAERGFFSSGLSLAVKWWVTLVVIAVFAWNNFSLLLGFAFLLGEVARVGWLGGRLRARLLPQGGISSLRKTFKSMPWQPFFFFFATAIALHVNPLVARAMAGSLGGGAISMFEYAWTIYLLPTMVFTSGYLVVTYSTLAQLVAEGKNPQLKEKLVEVERHIWRYSGSALLVLGVVAVYVESVSQAFGRLSQDQTATVVWLALGLSFGLPFALGNVVNARFLILLNQTAWVLHSAIVKALVNFLFLVVLLPPLGLQALAVAAVVSEVFAYLATRALIARHLRRARELTEGG